MGGKRQYNSVGAAAHIPLVETNIDCHLYHCVSIKVSCIHERSVLC